MRTLVVCPGRGSYGRATLGILQDRSEPAAAIIDACEAWRADHGRPLLRHLDNEPAFRGALHVAGQHASLLTFAASLADLAELDRERFEVVGVVGNSLGWYTALAAAGALPLDHAIELVDTMGQYQASGALGVQIMTSLVDEHDRPDPALREAVDDALAAARLSGAGAWWSIDLGSHAVLGADAPGARILEERLPRLTRGERSFPLRLPLHSAFHTPLLEPTAERARQDLAHLDFRAPDVPLVDGRGTVFRPRWADRRELRDYTLGHQVTRPFDFHQALVTALHHTGAQAIVLLGPGNSLGGPVSRMLVWDGWSGCRTRTQLDDRQASAAPLLLSFGVRLQRKRLVAQR